MRAIVFLLGVCLFVTDAGAQTKKPTTSRKAKAAAKSKRPEMPYGRAIEVGDKGTLWTKQFKIIQVIDDENVIGETEWYSGTVTAGRAGVLDTRQDHPFIAWFTCPTKGMVDGRMVDTDAMFEAIGTKSYQTAAGKRTVIHLKFVDEETDEAKKKK